MPQRSVYIREEDDEKWMACKEKSLLIHNALNPPEEFKTSTNIFAKGIPAPNATYSIESKMEGKPIKTPKTENVGITPDYLMTKGETPKHVNFLDKKKGGE